MISTSTVSASLASFYTNEASAASSSNLTTTSTSAASSATMHPFLAASSSSVSSCIPASSLPLQIKSLSGSPPARRAPSTLQTRRMMHAPIVTPKRTTPTVSPPSSASSAAAVTTKPPSSNVNVYQWIRELNDYVGCIENWATWLHQRLNHTDTAQFLRMVQLSRQNYLHPQDIFRRQLRMEQPIQMTEVQSCLPSDLSSSTSSS